MVEQQNRIDWDILGCALCFIVVGILLVLLLAFWSSFWHGVWIGLVFLWHMLTGRFFWMVVLGLVLIGLVVIIPTCAIEDYGDDPSATASHALLMMTGFMAPICQEFFYVSIGCVILAGILSCSTLTLDRYSISIPIGLLLAGIAYYLTRYIQIAELSAWYTFLWYTGAMIVVAPLVVVLSYFMGNYAEEINTQNTASAPETTTVTDITEEHYIDEAIVSEFNPEEPTQGTEETTHARIIRPMTGRVYRSNK